MPLKKNKKHFHVQNGLLHANGRYRFQNVAKSKEENALRQTMQDCSGEIQVM